MKIVADAHIPYIKDYFNHYGELILKPGRDISRADVADADMLIVRSITRVNEELLANTRIKFVGSVTAGADHLDTKWLEDAGIVWTVATGFNAPPVADYVVSVIAALQKKNLLAYEGRKAAVIGVGNVGRLVVDRLQLLNFDIVQCDPIRAQNEKNFHSIPLDELSDLDLISIHVPLSKVGSHPTFHFLDKHFLQRQKPGCILLNASRGAVIDSNELLQFGQHMHWCFDVWEHEPNIDKQILKNALIATPHIAGYSVQSKIRGIDLIYEIACAKKIIEPMPISPIIFPHQMLNFSDDHHGWREIVLGVLNPWIMTMMMQTILLSTKECGHAFDEMRNQFNYRHEFEYTRIADIKVSQEDKKLLQKLKLRI